MKALILLHSATGNTRLVALYAASRLKMDGYQVDVHDIVKKPTPPSLDDVDLLGVACPTMYFRPTFAMQRFIARMPAAESVRRPAFLLATCSGDPGAHFPLLAEQLASRGFYTLGARHIIFSTSWPIQITIERHWQFTTPIGSFLSRNLRSLRPSTSTSS